MFDSVWNMQEGDSKTQFLTLMHTGAFLEKDVLVFNAGESELDADVSYYEIGRNFRTYTEVTGAYTMDRFQPIPKNMTIVSYPFCWLQDQIVRHGSNESDLDLSVYRQVTGANAPRVLFTYMMRQPKAHRRMIWDLLEANELINEYCTNAEKGISIDLSHNFRGDVIENNYDSVFWQTHSFPEWYFDCLIDLVPETHVNQMFFTEKTWRAFLGMRIPLIIGAQNQMKQLNKMGFKFPEWTRWSEWDNKKHEYDRVRGCIETLHSLSKKDVSELWETSYYERRHNMMLCFDLATSIEPPFEGYGEELQWDHGYGYRSNFDFTRSISANVSANI